MHDLTPKRLFFGAEHIGQITNLKMKVDEELEALLVGTDVYMPPVGQSEEGKVPVSESASIDSYVSLDDRRMVKSLPEEGKRQFRENVHQYIGQLGKDYQIKKDEK